MKMEYFRHNYYSGRSGIKFISLEVIYYIYMPIHFTLKFYLLPLFLPLNKFFLNYTRFVHTYKSYFQNI